MTEDLVKINKEGETTKDMLSIDNFKAIYYQFNAKPDSEVKIFKKSKLISYADLNELNTKVEEKLNNHDIAGHLTYIKIALSDKRILDLNSWDQFQKTDWAFSATVSKIDIEWDFNIVIPNYKNPQRHTLKVKVGSKPNPREMLQYFFDNDNIEQEESFKARMVCRTDFINSVISTELINIVSAWYEALPNLVEENSILEFAFKYERQVMGFVSILFNLMGVIVGFLILKYAPSLTSSYSQNPNIVVTIAYTLSILWSFVYIFGYIGDLVGYKVSQHINDFKMYSPFLISKGDINKHKDQQKRNQKILLKVVSEVFIGLVTNILLLLGQRLLEPEN